MYSNLNKELSNIKKLRFKSLEQDQESKTLN